MNYIDLRSDTLTKPTEKMLEAMRNAVVGDDGYREDPTVNRLEELGAEITGKESGLLFPSGTMANEVAIMTFAHRGEEIIVESNSHILVTEMAGPTVLSSVQIRTVDGNRGILEPESVKAAIRPKGKMPKTSLLCVENTHNRNGGTVTSPEKMKALAQLGKAHDMAVYVDGARIFNASVALGVKASELLAGADAAMFCLSKGLSCPIGSILVGKGDFIDEARKYRALLGGQMRQAGYIAGAGIVALNTMVDRLAEDHENARRLAEGIRNINGIYLDMDRVQTNIVIFDISPLKVGAPRFLDELGKNGVRAFAFSENIIRMCVHRHITREDIKNSILATEKTVKGIRNTAK